MSQTWEGACAVAQLPHVTTADGASSCVYDVLGWDWDEGWEGMGGYMDWHSPSTPPPTPTSIHPFPQPSTPASHPLTHPSVHPRRPPSTHPFLWPLHPLTPHNPLAIKPAPFNPSILPPSIHLSTHPSIHPSHHPSILLFLPYTFPLSLLPPIHLTPAEHHWFGDQLVQRRSNSFLLATTYCIQCYEGWAERKGYVEKGKGWG